MLTTVLFYQELKSAACGRKMKNDELHGHGTHSQYLS